MIKRNYYFIHFIRCKWPRIRINISEGRYTNPLAMCNTAKNAQTCKWKYMIYPSCMLRWLYRIKFKFPLYGNQNMKYYIYIIWITTILVLFQFFEIQISTNLFPKWISYLIRLKTYHDCTTYCYLYNAWYVIVEHAIIIIMLNSVVSSHFALETQFMAHHLFYLNERLPRHLH